MNRTCVQVTTAVLQLAFATAAAAGDSQATERMSGAEQIEAADALPRTAFYETDSAAFRGEAGSLIRSEAFTGYELPAQTRATRILYRSRSQLDRNTVASAVVIVPTRDAPAGGWPVVVWAHGMTGTAQSCAPSLTKSLGSHVQTLVKEGVSQGFAVVSIDYSGLGAGGQHEFLWKTADANDMVYAVPAARAAEAKLSPAWIAMGYSEGGLAVWGVAEKMAKAHDAAYRGGLALVPMVDPDTSIPRMSGLPGQTFYPLYVAFGIKTVYPNFDTRAMLQPAGINAYQHLTTRGCRGVAQAQFESLRLDAVLDPRWTVSPQVQKLLNSDLVGKQPIAGPLFVAGADSDQAVPAQLLAARVKLQCATGATVDYQAYPGDHASMMLTSFGDQVSWIRDRFQDKPSPNSCK